MRLRLATAALAVAGACDEPSRAVVRGDASADAADVGSTPSGAAGAPGAGDCAVGNGGCSAYARCEPAGAGMRRCVCAAGLRVKADQRACEGLLLVSVARDGRAGTGMSLTPALAASGRFVAFTSESSELATDGPIAPTATPVRRCFLRDVVAGRTVWISARSDGGTPTTPSATGGCDMPQVTSDGRRVAFLADGTIDLADPPQHPFPHAYVRDLDASMRPSPPRRLRLDLVRPLNDHTSGLAMSRDGRRFVVTSRARLVAAPGPSEYDVYLVTDAPPSVTAVSVDAAGAFPTYDPACGGNNELGPLSGDGNFVAFHGPRAYAPGDDDRRRDSYLRDLTVGRTELLSARRTAAPPARPCSYRGAGGIGLSYDARYAIFLSDNARVDDTLGPDEWDYFYRDRAYPIDDPRGLVRLRLGPLVLPTTLDQYRDLGALSDDGRVAAVVSYRRLDRPDVTDVAAARHLYVLDLSDPAMPLRGAVIADVDAAGEPSASSALPFLPSLAADGSAVAFVSYSPLLPSDGNTHPDVYLRVLR